MSTDSREALLSWADHTGRFSLPDVAAILAGHGLTMGDWLNDCEARHWDARVTDAELLVQWLGY